MSHNPEQTLHGYANRGLDIRINVSTSGVPGDFTEETFTVSTVEKTTGFTKTAGGDGVLVDFTLTAEQMDLTPAWYRWELVATVAFEPRTIAHGWFHVGSTPTGEEES